MYFDSHCHLDKLKPVQQNGLGNTIADARAAGVKNVVCISVNLEQLPTLRKTIEGHAGVYSTVGVHPCYQDREEPDEARLIELAQYPGVVAIGETGLDYFKVENPVSEMKWQRDRFRRHIRAAKQLGLPVVIHTRGAKEDTLAILREEGAEQCGGIIHCFTEDWVFAEAAMELGFYISLSGIVTFHSAKALQEVAKRLPKDRILIETDAPWLAPVPHRGKENQPAWVAHVAEYLAELRGEPIEEVARYSTENAKRCFALTG